MSSNVHLDSSSSLADNTDPVQTVQAEIQQLISDMLHGAPGTQLTSDYNKFASDANALLQTGGVPAAFKAAIENMLQNGNDLSTYVGMGGGDVNAAIGQASALLNQLSGTNSMTAVNEDLETLQQDLMHGASQVQLTSDYKKLLQDGYALKDEGAAPMSFLQSFDNMVANNNDLSTYVGMGGGDVNAAIGQVNAFMDQLSGSNSLSKENEDLENLQQDLTHSASQAQLQADYKKLLQDGYALKDENGAPIQYLQAFDTMVNSGNALSNYVESGAGSPADAKADVQNLLNLLA